MMLEEMELDGTDARKVELDAPRRRRAPRSRSSSSAAASRDCSPASGCRRPASRSRSSRRTPDVGGTWCENSYPGVPRRRRQPLLLLLVRAERPLDRVLRPAARDPAYFARRHAPARHRPAHPLEHRGGRPPSGDDEHGAWAVAVRDRRRQTRRRSSRARSSPRSASSTGRTCPTSRAATTSRAPSFHSARWDHSVDYRGKRVAVIGAGASGFQIVPTIARRRRRAHRLPAHRAVDVPESELPRAGRPGRAVGAAPPAVLRALVPVLVVLARLRRRARGGARRSRVAATRTARSARPTTSPARSSPRGSASRSATIPSCSPR